ncbi:MAG: TonB-dependent receptor [Prevotellaceae bacterium]|nr:TonB-dependent receptor [Prevotellaceae bacterium]
MERQRCFKNLKFKLYATLVVCMTLLLNVQFLNAQNSTISVKGVVNDAMGPITGASVIEKGNVTNGTITDLDGNFTLNVSPGATLVISFIGYKTQEVALNGRNSINTTLHEDTEMLEEVVVVGFGTQKKVNLTGSVGLATAKDLESRPVTSATQALQGLVPGLQITTTTGELDNNMSINIRGNGTIGDGSSGSPLILIDGMEGDLNTVNPQDIENISVLKDAAAASIYGSRAPFGVILVTTKKGRTGKPVVNYNNSFRFNSPIRMPRQMDSYTFANYFNQAGYNANSGAIFTDETMRQMLDFQAAGGTNRGGLLTDGDIWGKPAGDPFTTGFANTDWYHEIYKDVSFSHEHNLSISGGGEKFNYYASLGYLDQNGLLRPADDTMRRFNASAKFGAELTGWLKFNYSIRYIRQDLERPANFNNGLYEKIGRQTWPNLPVYDENGYYHNSNADTPVMQLAEGGTRNVQTDKIYQQAGLVIEPVKNWVTNVEFNYSLNDVDTRQTSLPYYNHDVAGNIVDTNGNSSLYQDYTKETYMNWNIYSTYSFTVNDDHNIKVMAGFQSEEMRQKFFSAQAWGLQVEDLPELDLVTNLYGNGSDKAPQVAGHRLQWASAGFFGRVNYDYKGRYLVEGNLRYDGSSCFRRGSRWLLSPSFSLGWNIAQESFWENFTNTCNLLKLRFSYGVLGNMNTTNWYPTYRTMVLSQVAGSWLQDGNMPNTAYVGDLISTSLTWEKVRTWNVGLDFGLFNNRLSGTFDTYVRFTDNMVGPSEELPATLGIGTPKTNNCDLKTKGWELTLSWQDQTKFGLGYGVKLNVSDARTYIDRYPGNPTNSISTYIAGRETGEIWGFKTVGIAKTDDQMQAHLNKVGGQSAIGTNWTAGDIMYADLDGKDGITKGGQTLGDHGDLKVIGNNTPRYLFGLDLNANYKGFDMRLFFQGVMKRDYTSSSMMFWGVYGSEWWSTGFKEHADYFHADAIGLEGHKIAANTDAFYPRPIFDDTKNQEEQSRYLQNAAYIRLKNFQLGYTIPSALTQRIGISNCRVFVSGENLWTGTKLSRLFDPETLSGGYSDGGGNAYPLSRTWSFGVSISL